MLSYHIDCPAENHHLSDTGNSGTKNECRQDAPLWIIHYAVVYTTESVSVHCRLALQKRSMRIQTLDLPPDAGRRLFPQVIEDLALRTPDRIIYEFATGTKVEDGFRTVSCQQYANSINRVSWFLDETLGKATSNETVGYVGLGL